MAKKNQVKVEITGDNKGLKKSFKDSEQVVKVSSKNMADSVLSAGKKIGAAYAAIAGSKIALGVIRLADSYTNLESQLKLVTTSAENLAAVQDELFDISQQNRSSFTDTVNVYARFSRATEDASVSQRDLLTVVEGLTRANIVSGATAAESEAAMLQLSQGMASGVLRGQELNSIMEQTPRIARMLADGLDVPIGQLRKMGEAGELTTEKVVGALLEQSDVVAKEFDTMAMTVGQSWVKITNSIGSFVHMGDDAAGVTGLIAEKLSDVSGWIDGISDPSGDVAQNLETILNTSSNLYDVMEGIDELGGPSVGEWGLIGYALFRGGPQAAAVTGAMVVLNEQLESYNLNIGSLVDSYQGLSESTGNLWDVFTGKRDWNTGELIDPIVTLKEEIDAARQELDKLNNLAGPMKFLNDLAGGQDDVAFFTDKVDRLNIELGLLEGNGVGATDMFMGLGAAEQRTAKITAKLNKETEKSVEIATKQSKAIKIVATDQYTALKASKTRAKGVAKLQKQETKDAKKAASERSKAYKAMYDDMDEYAEDNYDLQKELLEEQADDYKALGAKEEVVNQWRERKSRDLYDEMLLNNGTFVDGVGVGYRRMIENQESWADNGLEVFDSFIALSSNAFSDGLFDVLTGDFDSLGDVWDGLWKGMLGTLVDVLGEMVVKYTASKVTSWISKFFHDGSYEVMRNDEGLAILEQGEMIIPSDQADQIRTLINTSGQLGYTNGSGSDSGGRPSQGGIGVDVAGYLDSVSSPAAYDTGFSMSGYNLSDLTPNGISGFVQDSLLSAMGFSKASGFAPADTGLGFFDNALNGVYSTIGSPVGIGQLLGQMIGGFFGPAGFAAGGILGGIAGDLAADGFDARENEGLRDVLEDNHGMIGGRQAYGAIAAAGVNFDSVDSVKAQLDAYFDAIANQSRDVPSHETIGHPDFGLNVLGELESLGVGGPSPDDGTGRADQDAAAAGAAAAAAGLGFGNFGDDLGGGFGDMPGEEGYRLGGVASGSNLGYPVTLHGTEAVVPLPDGRTIPVQIQGADREGRELLESVKELIKTVKQGNYHIAKNTGDIAYMLKRWDGDGMPEERVV